MPVLDSAVMATENWGSLIKPVADRSAPLGMEHHVDAATMPSHFGMRARYPLRDQVA